MHDPLTSIGAWFRRHPNVRDAAKPLLDRVVTAAERVSGFRTMPGSYLPHRVAVMCSTYEPAETRFLMARAATARLILDIGANVGYFARRMAAVAPPATLILACEPNPLLTTTLVANLHAFPNVRVFPCGLSDTPKPLTLHMAGREYATASVARSLVLAVARDDRSTLREIPCLFTTGRHLIEGLGGAVPDLVKIDVEGWELPALQGFGPMVTQAQIATILFELNPKAQRLAGHEPLGVVRFLKSAGYSISRLTELGELCETNEAQDDDLLRHLGRGGFVSLVATNRR